MYKAHVKADNLSLDKDFFSVGFLHLQCVDQVHWKFVQ